MRQARRHPWRSLLAFARRGLLTLCFFASGAVAQVITDAEYREPTDRYAHGVLGDAIEWGGLEISTDNRGEGLVSDATVRQQNFLIRLPLDRVFEDVAPRLADLDGDGGPEVIVVETQVNQGAQLAVYDETGKIASTPHIGTRNRWLAPIGAADLDGDGVIEIAYIDRPHLNKTLRIWRYRDGTLMPVADIPGLSNHRIGEEDIAGGIRDCGAGPEMITASADWRDVIATRFDDGTWVSRRIGAHDGRDSFAKALSCE